MDFWKFKIKGTAEGICHLTLIVWTRHNPRNFDISVNLHGNPMKSKLQLQIGAEEKEAQRGKGAHQRSPSQQVSKTGLTSLFPNLESMIVPMYHAAFLLEKR